MKITGLTETVHGLQVMGVAVVDLKGAFGPIAAEGARVTAGFIRSRSGRLAGTARGSTAKSYAKVTVGRASVPYAGVQNYGWGRRNIEPQGFFAKTDKVLQPRSTRLIEDALNDAIRRSGL